MLNDMKIKAIEDKLNDLAEVYYATSNAKTKELNRGYCQGIAFVLEQIGYVVEWDNGRAIITE